MTIELDHAIVPSHHVAESAGMLAELLGVPWSSTGVGPFAPVFVNDGMTLDFIDTDDAFSIYHFCFRVSEGDFDAILRRLNAAGIAYRSDVRGGAPWRSTSNTVGGWCTGTSPTAISGKC